MSALRTLVRVFILGRRRGMRSRIRRRVWSMAGFTSGGGFADDVASTSAESLDPPAGLKIPEGFTRVASTSELPPGSLMEVFVGDVSVALGNVEGQFHAVGNACPHAGGPIGDGVIEGDRAVCPYHGWAFSLESGVCDFNKDISVPVYAVRVESGQICVQV